MIDRGYGVLLVDVTHRKREAARAAARNGTLEEQQRRNQDRIAEHRAEQHRA